jgi:N utilization substance protein A
MTVKLGTEEIRNIGLFVKVTGVQPKDCLITEDCVYFLVNPRGMIFAIGKNGANVKKLRKKIGKNIKLFAKYETLEKTIQKMIPNIKNIKINDNTIIISIPFEDKSRIIGRNGNNIKAIKELLRRHFSIKDLKVRM